MKFKSTTVTATKEILWNDHYVGEPFDCTGMQANDKGYIPAGTIVPANDATAKGVLLSDVKLEDNPNGTMIIHGFIKSAALPVAPAEAAKTALKQISFM